MGSSGLCKPPPSPYHSSLYHILLFPSISLSLRADLTPFTRKSLFYHSQVTGSIWRPLNDANHNKIPANFPQSCLRVTGDGEGKPGAWGMREAEGRTRRDISLGQLHCWGWTGLFLSLEHLQPWLLLPKALVLWFFLSNPILLLSTGLAGCSGCSLVLPMPGSWSWLHPLLHKEEKGRDPQSPPRRAGWDQGFV